MKSIFIKVIGICLMALMSCSALAFTQQAYGSEPIKIAVIAPQTGPASGIGMEALRGVKIARDVQNAKGGIRGRKIEYVLADTPDPTSAIAECERLLSVKGVNVIVSSMISGLSHAIAPIAERRKVVSWHVNCASDKVTQQGFKYLFRTSAYGSEEGIKMAEFACDSASKLGIKPEDARVAIIFEDGVYGTYISETNRKRSEELGMNIVAFEGYSKKTQDLSSLIMRVKRKNPDIILISAYVPDSKIYLRQSKTLGLKPKILVATGSGIGTGWFGETYGDRANGFCSGNWPIERTSEKYAPGLPEFVRLYREMTGRKQLYSCHSSTGYTGMLILWDVLQRAKSVDDPDAIREAALETDIPMNTIGCGWGAKFAPPGHPMMGTNLRAETIMTQWQDGELWTVWPIAYPGRGLILPMRTTLPD